MIGVTLLAATITVTLVSLAVLCVVAVRAVPVLQPDGGPFGLPEITDPASETMTGGPAGVTLAGDWHEVRLNNLTDVEEFLDGLEAGNVRHRELSVVGNDTFVIRWR